jgi:hypothetical protein
MRSSIFCCGTVFPEFPSARSPGRAFIFKYIIILPMFREIFNTNNDVSLFVSIPYVEQAVIGGKKAGVAGRKAARAIIIYLSIS